MESQPQNPEFIINPENFTHVLNLIGQCHDETIKFLYCSNCKFY